MSLSTTDEIPRGKLFFALLANGEDTLARAVRRLALDYSPVDVRTRVLPARPVSLPATGENYQVRQWIATQIPPLLTEFVEIKRFTRRLELIFAAEGIRSVNINPGYVTSSRAVLLTSRDADHRLFLHGGVYAEPVFRFPDACTAEPWSWTPDEYRNPEVVNFFLNSRDRLSAARTAEIMEVS